MRKKRCGVKRGSKRGTHTHTTHCIASQVEHVQDGEVERDDFATFGNNVIISLLVLVKCEFFHVAVSIRKIGISKVFESLMNTVIVIETKGQKETCTCNQIKIDKTVDD